MFWRFLVIMVFVLGFGGCDSVDKKAPANDNKFSGEAQQNAQSNTSTSTDITSAQSTGTGTITTGSNESTDCAACKTQLSDKLTGFAKDYASVFSGFDWVSFIEKELVLVKPNGSDKCVLVVGSTPNGNLGCAIMPDSCQTGTSTGTSTDYCASVPAEYQSWCRQYSGSGSFGNPTSTGTGTSTVKEGWYLDLSFDKLLTAGAECSCSCKDNPYTYKEGNKTE